jgi:hypothetical protein
MKSLSYFLLIAMAIFVTSWTQAQPTGQISLFKHVKSVQVTPSDNYQNADFVRIGYVPGRNRFIVTFNTMVSDSGWCSESFDAFYGLYRVYAYKEYTADMDETGKDSIVSCHGTTDTGGLLIGDDLYLASMEFQNSVPGWYLARFNTVTWASLVEYFYPFSDFNMQAADPTVAFVNGQIDISGIYEVGGGTHHNFFTTDLQFVRKMLLSDTPHNGFSAMITLGGITHFLSSRAGTPQAPWAVIVMHYDLNWAFLGVKSLREHAATPQGLAFDGSRFYVAYTERTDGFPFAENIHLAAFDLDWNLIEDIALTNFTLQDSTSSIHPYLALRNNRLYVSYSQNAPAGGIETLQAYVKVYDMTPATGIVSPGGQSIFPDQLQLEQNHPNPFNPSTTIEYQLPSRAYINISIYNSLGQLVRVLYSGESSTGNHSIVWDSRDDSGRSVATGTYFYQVKVGDVVQTKKALLIK